MDASQTVNGEKYLVLLDSWAKNTVNFQLKLSNQIKKKTK